MESALTVENETKIVDLNYPTHKSSPFWIFLVLLFILTILAGVSFGVGYLVGKINLNQSSTVLEKKTGQTSVKINGEKKVFSDSSQGYLLTFPKDWEIKNREMDIPGALLTGGEASIEIWLLVKETLAFSTEQRNAIEKTTASKIEISQKEAQVVEYIYKAGNYFTTIEIEGSEKTPRITFWIKSANSADYQTARDIVSSFTFS